ncbi:unnamed protein product [Mytilus coruscus]|uniref:Uncharacterized protein n=1 Tax=Mytilus coruscus TaxID=42192 RepID=A0A6J8DT31_MYTCO|nr:unnamed protein product [Mytilus coruscus]
MEQEDQEHYIEIYFYRLDSCMIRKKKLHKSTKDIKHSVKKKVQILAPHQKTSLIRKSIPLSTQMDIWIVIESYLRQEDNNSEAVETKDTHGVTHTATHAKQEESVHIESAPVAEGDGQQNDAPGADISLESDDSDNVPVRRSTRSTNPPTW